MSKALADRDEVAKANGIDGVDDNDRVYYVMEYLRLNGITVNDPFEVGQCYDSVKGFYYPRWYFPCRLPSKDDFAKIASEDITKHKIVQIQCKVDIFDELPDPNSKIERGSLAICAGVLYYYDSEWFQLK